MMLIAVKYKTILMDCLFWDMYGGCQATPTVKEHRTLGFGA
jgi:hypothetical protein